MMSRKDEFKKVNENPALRFLEWKSNDKCFQFYDKEKKRNFNVELPFKFVTLKEMHSVKGWSDSSESAIYSNEVNYIGTEELNVRSFKGGEICKGLYKDCKLKIQSAGGHYVKSIYIMVEGGEVWNIQLKGSAVQQWGEFTQKTRSRLADEWVECVSADERKKGSIKYAVPVFQFNTSLNDVEGDLADKAYDVINSYLKQYLKKDEETVVIDSMPDGFDDVGAEHLTCNDLQLLKL